MTELREHVIVTNENVTEVYEYIFAPWVKAMGLMEFKVGSGTVSALLPQNPALQWANGAICGQAIMAAIDTIVSLATTTTERDRTRSFSGRRLETICESKQMS